MNSSDQTPEADPAFTLHETATPLRCPTIMVVQPLTVWTVSRLLGAAFAILLSAPSLILQPAVTRRRA